jgi:glutamate 5-kinase
VEVACGPESRFQLTAAHLAAMDPAPAGVIEVVGQFDEGDTLDITGRDGTVFARGMAAAEARVLRRTAGQRTRDLPADVAHEAIHRDDLVVLP